MAVAPNPVPPKPKRFPWPAVLAAVVVIAVVVVGAILIFGGGDDDKGSASGQKTQSTAELTDALKNGSALLGPRTAPFALRYTDNWVPLGAGELKAGTPPPMAGVKRKDGTGVITVSVRGPVRGGIKTLQQTLPGELAKRFADFKLVSIRQIQLSSGPALYTTWIRTKTGRVQSNLVLPQDGRQSYSVDAVLRGDAKQTAQETGAILRSFGVVQK